MKRKSSAMVYKHGWLVWAFRVVANKSGVLENVFLVQIYETHLLQEDNNGQKVIKYFIVGRASNKREPKRPVIDKDYFKRLLVIDGLPGKSSNTVSEIFEKVFTLGFVVGVENNRLADLMPLNEHVRALIDVAEHHNINIGPSKQVLRNVYRFGVWCGANWHKLL